jgi:hypothetical protein
MYHPAVAGEDLPSIPGNLRRRIADAIETRLTEAGSEAEADDLFFRGLEEFKRALELAKRYRVIHAHTHHAAIIGAIRFFRKWDFVVDAATSAWVTDLLSDAKVGFENAFDWNSFASNGRN